MHKVYHVVAQWDSEAGTWVAECDDVSSPVAEAESPNLHGEKHRVSIPELLKQNEVLEISAGPMQFRVHSATRS